MLFTHLMILLGLNQWGNMTKHVMHIGLFTIHAILNCIIVNVNVVKNYR